jgi:hypothetical protein
MKHDARRGVLALGWLLLPVLTGSACQEHQCTSWPEGAARGGLTLSYAGYGTARACQDGAAWRWVLSPRSASGPSDTHAALARTAAPAGSLDVQVRIRTRQRLRGQANPWEAGWLIWRYTDDHHFYYLVLKPNGFEIGKEDPAYPGAQRYLVTRSTPRFEVSAWHTIEVRQSGATMAVTVDGRPLASVHDRERPYATGDVGLYTEDAVAEFTGLRISWPGPGHMTLTGHRTAVADLRRKADLLATPAAGRGSGRR